MFLSRSGDSVMAHPKTSLFPQSLYNRFRDDLQLAGKSTRTQQAYLRAVRQLVFTKQSLPTSCERQACTTWSPATTTHHATVMCPVWWLDASGRGDLRGDRFPLWSGLGLLRQWIDDRQIAPNRYNFNVSGKANRELECWIGKVR